MYDSVKKAKRRGMWKAILIFLIGFVLVAGAILGNIWFIITIIHALFPTNALSPETIGHFIKSVKDAAQ